MIAEEFRWKQIRRMAGLDKYPKNEPEAEAELVIVAGKFGRSEAHLRGVIDEIIGVWTKCVKPAELRSMLERDRGEFVDPHCIFCAGSGWKIIEKDGAKRYGYCSDRV